MWLLRQHTHLSTAEIVRAVFRRDHTSVLYGLSVIEAAIARDPEYLEELEAMVAPVSFAAALEAA